ncbi:MAG TPA: hypothetical protein VFT95_05820 [Micromonosporaceae bacterium]|nr:hypothetical protein [Micromonosporaceae bacterium]
MTDTTPTPEVVCAYFGPPGECPECGGFNDTGGAFCSHDCAAARSDRDARHDADRQVRRAREDLFAAEVARLRGLGYSYEECDVLLAGLPT